MAPFCPQPMGLSLFAKTMILLIMAGNVSFAMVVRQHQPRADGKLLSKKSKEAKDEEILQTRKKRLEPRDRSCKFHRRQGVQHVLWSQEEKSALETDIDMRLYKCSFFIAKNHLGLSTCTENESSCR
ncbi:hypothetical protein Plhal304r1_c003g0012681 [Plasmopara halstedii]